MNNYNTTALLEQLLKRSNVKSVDNAFSELIDKEINISKGRRSDASVSQKHLRDILTQERSDDPTFPRILSIQDNDFIGGSFARHTKIWPLDDIDIYFPLDGEGLRYLEGGIPAPYEVIGDGILSDNPLLGTRWTENEYISSKKIITEFTKVLKDYYPNTTKIKADGQAVNVQLRKGETKYEDGLGFDVVPCFYLRPHDTNKKDFYLIPSGQDGWIRTNPRIDYEISEYIQRKNNKIYRKVVKLLKYWNKEKAQGTIKSSYFIELAICREFLAQNNAGNIIDKISYGVALGFLALSNAIQAGSLDSFVEDAPKVSPGVLSIFDKELINEGFITARKAWEMERSGRESEAIKLWGKLFGNEFLTV